jgi:hypothetical protein
MVGTAHPTDNCDWGRKAGNFLTLLRSVANCLEAGEGRFDEVEGTEGASGDEGFAGGEIGCGAGQHRGTPNSVEDVGFAGRELRLVAADGLDLLLQRVADIDREMAGVAAEYFRLEGEAEIELGLDGVDGQVVEVLVPLGEAGIEDGGVGDLHGLPVIGRGEGRFVAEADDDLGAVLAELLGQGDTSLERVEEAAVGEVEGDSYLCAERLSGLLGFGEARFGTWRQWRGLAVSEVDDADLVALLDELGERATAGDLDVIGMGADSDDIELGILVNRLNHECLWLEQTTSTREEPRRLEGHEEKRIQSSFVSFVTLWFYSMNGKA